MAEIRRQQPAQGVRRLRGGQGLAASPSRTASSSCLLGPSGCGKTTTLRMIAGLELPTSGEIPSTARTSPSGAPRERDIAFVFQLFALYPHMNVRQNIGFPLLCPGLPRAEIRSRVEETAQAPAHRPSARPPVWRPCRRRPPARGAGPRHRPPAEGVPDGRAARHARRRVPRADVRGAARPARPASAPPRSTSPTTRSRPWRWPT